MRLHPGTPLASTRPSPSPGRRAGDRSADPPARRPAAQALCLTLVVNCVAAFNAGLLAPAVDQLRTTGFEIDDDDVSHLGPTMTEHINVHGRYHFNLDQTPKRLRDHARPSSRR